MTENALSDLARTALDPSLIGVAASLLLTQAELVAPEGYEDERGFHFGQLPPVKLPGAVRDAATPGGAGPPSA